MTYDNGYAAKKLPPELKYCEVIYKKKLFSTLSDGNIPL